MTGWIVATGILALVCAVQTVRVRHYRHAWHVALRAILRTGRDLADMQATMVANSPNIRRIH